MLSLNLPAFDAKIAARNGKNVIFDVIRRRYVALTPEEWVRQHRPLSSCSQGVSAGAYGKWGAGTAERYKETLWYSAPIDDLTARMIVEYKAPEIEITQKVFDQIAPATTWCWKWIIWLSATGFSIIVAA